MATVFGKLTQSKETQEKVTLRQNRIHKRTPPARKQKKDQYHLGGTLGENNFCFLDRSDLIKSFARVISFLLEKLPKSLLLCNVFFKILTIGSLHT